MVDSLVRGCRHIGSNFFFQIISTLKDMKSTTE
jgi:hypothetical protein